MFRSFVSLSLLSNLVSADTQNWTPVVSPEFDVVSECFSLAAAPDGKTLWAGIGDNADGTEIWKSSSGGSNWTSVFPDSSTKEKFNLFLGGAAISTEKALITGAVAQTYSTDGTKFQESVKDVLSPSQDAEVTPGGLYAMASRGLNFNGIATSKTGEKWTNYDLGVNETLFPARYAAFPTDSTFYATAGVFPTAQQDRSQVLQKFQNYGRDLKSGKSVFSYHEDVEMLADPVNCSTDATDCYSAGIFKSVDGGATWKQVYENINTGQNLYPNDIDCFDETHCVVVLEGQTCHILVTSDGGASWNETHTDYDTACSLMYTKYVSQTEVWAAGGRIARTNFQGHFWHSLDGGLSWTLEEHDDIWVIDLEVTADFGYALAEDNKNGATLLKYSATK